MTDDRHLWLTAQTLEDLGNLTAQWLEGTIAYLPAYYGDAPDEETAPLIATLATANRAGFLTTDSQPGQPLEDGSGQRAWVHGFGSENTCDKIRAACLGTDLIVIYTPPYCDNPTQIVVTIDDHAEFTWTGATLDEANIEHYYGADCPLALDALLTAWQIDIIDPVWGRNDLLWPTLDTAWRS
jgi:hypothetical protein